MTQMTAYNCDSNIRGVITLLTYRNTISRNAILQISTHSWTSRRATSVRFNSTGVLLVLHSECPVRRTIQLRLVLERPLYKQEAPETTSSTLHRGTRTGLYQQALPAVEDKVQQQLHRSNDGQLFKAHERHHITKRTATIVTNIVNNDKVWKSRMPSRVLTDECRPFPYGYFRGSSTVLETDPLATTKHHPQTYRHLKELKKNITSRLRHLVAKHQNE